MDKFQDSKNNHLALTQYYRWYQVYEVPFSQHTINNQLDILTDEIEVTSQAATTTGKEAIIEKFAVFEGWKNAHHVKNTQVVSLDDYTLKLDADILYQNIRPDNKKYSYSIHYSILMHKKDNDLPLFSSVNLQPTGTIHSPKFVSAYLDNRVASFVHYWLYLLETAGNHTDKFDELLAPDFELNLLNLPKITTLDALKNWTNNANATIQSVAYKPKNIVVKENFDKTISVSMDVESLTLTKEGLPVKGKTHQEWTLENNTDDRFARLKTMRITEKKV